MNLSSIEKHAQIFNYDDRILDGKHNLLGLEISEMAELLQSLGFAKFRAKQLWSWIYVHGKTSFDSMTNIAKADQIKLAELCVIPRPKVSKSLQSTDGTAKWLLSMSDGQEIEMVYIPETDRGTLCVSSQVGCTLACKFCHTGTQKLVRNLTATEILGQVMLARDAFGEWPTPQSFAHITNIVFMGMGEPLYNYDHVAKSLKILLDQNGLAFSKRKITVSTSGVVPLLRRLGEEINVNLAISLHATHDTLRSEIMAINKKYPLAELMDACRNYPGISNARRITFEYVMLQGINDQDIHARELISLLKGIPAKVNLIPFNPWPGSPYACSSRNRIAQFADILAVAGISAPVRATRGEDILAACGQLKSSSERQSKYAVGREDS